MNYCPLCGTPSHNNAKFCTNCGKEFPRVDNPNINDNYNNNYNVNYNQKPIVEEKNTFWWGALGFFIPMAGLVIFLIWMHERPKAAKSAGIGALIRVIITVILTLIFITFALVVAVETNDEDYHSSNNPIQRFEEHWSEYY